MQLLQCDNQYTDYKKGGKLTFELNKDELEEFCEELDTIESQLNDIFGEQAQE